MFNIYELKNKRNREGVARLYKVYIVVIYMTLIV